MKIPLPCFGLEHDPLDPVCCSCPHQRDCLWFMRSRANRIPLNRLNFDLIPHNLKVRWADFSYESDPEIPFLRHLYKECYMTVFNKLPLGSDNGSNYREDIIKAAREAHCSPRLLILANMVAYSIAQEAIVAHTEKARASRFHSSMLKGKLAVTRALAYAKVCNDRYGTFSLTSLSTYSGKNLELNEMDNAMLTSEITAGQFIVAHKIHHGGPPFEALYAEEEIALNPYWLAIEPSYMTTVLEPYRAGNKPTTAVTKDHRLDVVQVIGQFKRSLTSQTVAFRSRQKIMAQAVERVLSYFHLRPDDFVYEPAPITDPMTLWKDIGRTIQHYHCWLLLEGQPSYFKQRSAKEVHLGS